eukprot:m.246632 g.246632  ORF g.246632 m.246632 type:complete len:58 (+) comp15382_c0_seq2:3142-3315(+)
MGKIDNRCDRTTGLDSSQPLHAPLGESQQLEIKIKIKILQFSANQPFLNDSKSLSAY